MKNGWTGGQYSLLRGVLAVYLLFQMFPGLCQDLILPPPWDTPGPGILLVILGSVFCAALLAGWFDRPAAALLALLWFSVELPVLFYTRASSPLIGLLLLWHALLPAAPYLSLAARGRPDPGGGWRVPPRLFSLLWIGLSLFHMSRGALPLIGAALLPEFLAPGAGGPLAPADFTGAAIDLLFGPLALISRARPWIWTAMLLRLAVGGLPDGGLLLAHLFLFDPGWIRPRLAPRPEILFYDGRCGLCHRAVRFILAEDQTGRAFRFAPLAGETFRRTVPAEIRRGLPDSLVVTGDDGEMRVRARCVSHVLARLGGLWRALGVAGGVIPRSVADALYNSVARVRHRVFSAPGEVCPAVSDEMRRRFNP